MSKTKGRVPPISLTQDVERNAPVLLAQLQAGDLTAATSLIDQMCSERDRDIYQEVGKLTRGLHDAIVAFQIDVENYSLQSGATESQMADARDRLDYVIQMTQNAADRTMDMVESGMPMVASLGHEAARLKTEWQRLLQREIANNEFRDLYVAIGEFFNASERGASDLNEKFNAILMAQGFQDLTGQVIKKVISLVQEVELSLVELVRVAGRVEQVTGLERKVSSVNDQTKSGKDISAEGPQINAHANTQAVNGQDEVDDLLSSLGF